MILVVAIFMIGSFATNHLFLAYSFCTCSAINLYYLIRNPPMPLSIKRNLIKMIYSLSIAFSVDKVFEVRSSYPTFEGVQESFSLDKSVCKSLMIDTGASCNMMGQEWADDYTKAVLKPWKLWKRKLTKVVRFGGVGKGTVNAKWVEMIPIFLLRIIATFEAPVVPGGLPAILGLPTLMKMKAIINLENMSISLVLRPGEERTSAKMRYVGFEFA